MKFGNNESRDVPAFLDKIVTLQRRRQASAPPSPGAAVFYDRSPVCTLVLSHYTGVAPPRALTDEVDRIIAQRVYEPTVFFVRNQGFVQPTAARRISFEHSLVFERIHEEVYRDLGFQLMEVPAGPPPDRVALIRTTVERLTGQARPRVPRPPAGSRPSPALSLPHQE